jgi:hypothetical protein
MSDNIKIEWLNDFEKENFSNCRMNSFESFWDIENSASDIEFRHIKTRLDRRTGKPERQITCLKLNGIKYYLKRAARKAVKNIRTEFEALKILPDFGLETAKLLAYSFDKKNTRAFLLYRNLSGYYCLDDVINRRLPPETIASYQVREKDILGLLAKAVLRYQGKNYFYPDLKPKQVFVDFMNLKIALINLERFEPLNRKSWLHRFEFVRVLAHRKEIKRFLSFFGKKRVTLFDFIKLSRKRKE